MVKKYYLDPTRRPPIPTGKLETIKTNLSNRFTIDDKLVDTMSQVEVFDYVTDMTREVLDQHNPLNRNEKLSKKIYRFTMSKNTKKLQRKIRKAQDSYRTAKRRRRSSQEETEKLWLEYKHSRNVYNRAARDDKRKFGSCKLYDGVKNASSVWDILKKFNPIQINLHQNR